MVDNERNILVQRSLSAVAPVALIVREFARKYLGDLLASDVELAVVETLTNVIKHSKHHNRENSEILISLKRSATDIVVDIFDESPLIPPEIFETIGADALEIDAEDINALAESGRGLALILLSMDEVSMHADDELFRLHMSKRIP